MRAQYRVNGILPDTLKRPALLAKLSLAQHAYARLWRAAGGLKPNQRFVNIVIESSFVKKVGFGAALFLVVNMYADVIQFDNGQQRTDYEYYTMTQMGGRLYEIKTGATSPYTGTQHLQYDYDSVGNVASITDVNNFGQIQSFTYDHLDRLTAASTNAYGADQYSDTYAYSTIGNLIGKSPITLSLVGCPPE